MDDYHEGTTQMAILMDTSKDSTNNSGDLWPKSLSQEQHNSSNNFNNESNIADKLNQEMIDGLLNITKSQPLEYAMVMYGYIMPFLLILTIVANTLIVLVLAQKHMRTPTNLVLLSMAIADMLTLLLPSPWYFYLYTLGYHSQILYPPLVCYSYNSMTDVLPMFFHTASIWLTILLAGQRYIYICHPTAAKTWCTIPRVMRATISLFILAFSAQLSRFFDSQYKAIQFNWNGSQHMGCQQLIAHWVENIIKTNIYYPLYYGFRIIFVNIGPCLALVVLNFLLFRALREAQEKRKKLFKDKAESKKLRDSNSTTYMLIIVVTVFLLVEIPMAVATLIHVLASTSIIPFAQEGYKYLKITILISNFIIMLSFPLNFAIYCGMSRQFRITFRELFIKKVHNNGQRNGQNDYIPVKASTSL